jgi:hypothetical protein
LALDVVALPPEKSARGHGHRATVEGLPVVAFQADQFSCERDIWLRQIVLAVSADSFGVQVVFTSNGEGPGRDYCPWSASRLVRR